MPSDIQIYCNCIDRVRYHVSVADTVFLGKIETGHHDLNAELIFLHFRKALEEIAFASLSANREKYSAARAGFATEWNARRMLGFVEKINPNFYPVPLQPPQETTPGHKHFDRVTHGYLTKEDFAMLYDGSAEYCIVAILTRRAIQPSTSNLLLTNGLAASRRFCAGILCSFWTYPACGSFTCLTKVR